MGADSSLQWGLLLIFGGPAAIGFSRVCKMIAQGHSADAVPIGAASVILAVLAALMLRAIFIGFSQDTRTSNDIHPMARGDSHILPNELMPHTWVSGGWSFNWSTGLWEPKTKGAKQWQEDNT